jgi:hypothetical protein
MSILETSTVQDAMSALPESNPVMTVRVTKGMDGIEQVDIVTKAGLETQLKEGGVHVEARADVGSDVVQALEKALANNPTGQNAQTAMLERASNVPTAQKATPASEAPHTEGEKPAMVIRPIDPEKAVYGLEFDPANLNSKVLQQLKELESAQAFGAQTPAVIAKIEDAIYQARPDLKPQQQQPETSQNPNVAQTDAQGEVQKVVANSTGTQARTDAQQQASGSESTKVTATTIPMAQTNQQGEVTLRNAVEGSSQSQEDPSMRASSVVHQGNVTSKSPALAI